MFCATRHRSCSADDLLSPSVSPGVRHLAWHPRAAPSHNSYPARSGSAHRRPWGHAKRCRFVNLLRRMQNSVTSGEMIFMVCLRVLFVGLLLLGAAQAQRFTTPEDTARADALLKQMTIQEKIGQL